MVDPVFGNAAPVPWVVKRFVPSPLPAGELPELDFVVISHDHYDHLEYSTIRALRNKKISCDHLAGSGGQIAFLGDPQKTDYRNELEQLYNCSRSKDPCSSCPSFFRTEL